MRDIIILWDAGQAGVVTNMPAKEIRPGIAIVQNPTYLRRRYELLGWIWDTPYPEVPSSGPGAPNGDGYEIELDDLFRHIESTKSGKKLVEFFNQCRPFADPGTTIGGTYGPADPKHKINPRKLNAYLIGRDGKPDMGKPVNIGVVIIQYSSPSNAAHYLHLASATNGRGAFGTVEIYTRSLVLQDREAIPPELSLAHELIHAAHFIAGAEQEVGISSFSGLNPEEIARRMFDLHFGRSFGAAEKWLHPSSAPIFDALPDEVRDLILYDLENFDKFRDLAIHMTSGRFPSNLSSTGDMYFQQLAEYEETVTVGNEVCNIWLNGKRKRLTNEWRTAPASSFVKSNRVAAQHIAHIEKFKRDPLYNAVKERAVRAAEQRLLLPSLTETRISKEMRIRPRASYNPILSHKEKDRSEWMIKIVPFPYPRRDIPDDYFRESDPISALVRMGGNFGTEVDLYREDLAGWTLRTAMVKKREMLSSYTTPPRSCTTKGDLPAVTIKSIPDSDRQEAQEIYNDLTRNPDLAEILTEKLHEGPLSLIPPTMRS